MTPKSDFLKYLSASEQDEKWGLICTTVGYQNVNPHEQYPISAHPTDYNFTSQGRTLDEFQLIYITEGSGYFQSDSCDLRPVEAGTVILLTPGERHFYYPNVETGWKETWVGFRGTQAETIVSNFFTKEDPLLRVGVRESILSLYHKIISYSDSGVRGSQQVIAGVISYLLGRVYYEHVNFSNRGNKNTDKINQAQMLLRENINTHLSPADIAEQLSMSYSLLRSLFKQITGISMSGYQQQLKLNLAKELLTTSTKNISEIAYDTGFESVSRFCCFFKQHMKITASEFRSQHGILHKSR